MQEKIEKYLKRKVSNGVFPGCNYYIYCDSEEYMGSIGYKSLVPVKEKNSIDTIYDLASLSKLVVTTVLISFLIRDKKIKLEDKVKDYLPKFIFDDVLILHLLTHSSGILVTYDKNNIKSKNSFFTEMKRSFSPGSEAMYADINYILLGFIIEKIYGDSLDKIAKKYIFEPLDMNDTYYNPKDIERCAPVEVIDNNVLRGIPSDEKSRFLKGVAGHAGVYSTISDISKFLKMILNDGYYKGKQIIEKKYIDLWFTPLFLANDDTRRTIGWVWGKSSIICNKFCSDDSVVHTGFTGGTFFIDRAQELIFVILSNRVHPTRDNKKIFTERINICNYFYKVLKEYNKIF